MEFSPRKLEHYSRKVRVFPKTEDRVKPFDVETTFAEIKLQTQSRARKFCGPDSPLYSAIYPAICVMKLFGVAPYDFTKDRMTPSNPSLIFSFSFLTIYSYIMYIVFLRFVSLQREKPILAVVETTKVIVNYLVVMYELIWTMLNRRAFVEIWNALQDYDQRLDGLGYPRKETKTKIVVWTYLITQGFAWTMVNQSGMYAFMETWPFNVSYMLTYVGSAVSVYKFAGMVFFLEQRFRQLNQIARENLPPKVGFKSTTVSRKVRENGNQIRFLFKVGAWCNRLKSNVLRTLQQILDCTLLNDFYTEAASQHLCHLELQHYFYMKKLFVYLFKHTIQDLHDELMLIGEALNSFSSWSLLFWLGNLSVHSVSNTYFIMNWLVVRTWSSLIWPLIFNMFCWLIVFLTQLLTLHISCDYATDQANSMGAILVEWDARILQRFPHGVNARVSLHFLNRRLHFSAGGLFNVDLPLLCSIVGVLSTYLIILLQFPD